MENKIYKLMIPGPVQPEDEVLEVMSQPVKAHYGHEWRDFYNQTTDCLKQIFQTDGDVHLIVGSGSAGIDACIGSAFAVGEKILVGVNGFFGERIKEIAECYGLRVIPVESAWGTPLKPEDFISCFDAHPDASGVAVVHLETSTTIVNPIAEIGEITRARGVAFFVDAVSSLGGLRIKMDDWNIDLCASCSQKCLGAPPGLSPVAVGKKGWEIIERNSNINHGWYLNLNIWRRYSIEWADWHPFPITMATTNVVALNTSLKKLLADNINTRIERNFLIAKRLREGLRKINFLPYTPDSLMAPVITAAYGPKGIPTSRIVNYLAEDHGIKIAGGLGILKDKIIRIGHMSHSLTENDIDEVLEALKDFKQSF